MVLRNNMENNQSFLVCIRCSTYNHAPYIEDALNGFVMQQTTFPYIAMVVDDASTDGEQEVVASYVGKYFDINDQNLAYNEETDYAHITFAQHKTNKNCFIVVLYLKENHYQTGRNSKRIEYLAEWRDAAKYEALCEGDDYWIDPLKLQKQVDFLENNREYSLCFHAAAVWNGNNVNNHSVFSMIQDREYAGVEIFKKWQIPTASVVYNLDIYKSQVYEKVSHSTKFIYGDTPLFCAASCIGKLRGMSNIMSVYRRHDGGTTMIEKPLSFRKRFYEHILEFGNVFGGEFQSCCKMVAAKYTIDMAVQMMKRSNLKDMIYFIIYSFQRNALQTIKAIILYLFKYIKKNITLL